MSGAGGPPTPAEGRGVGRLAPGRPRGLGEREHTGPWDACAMEGSEGHSQAEAAGPQAACGRHPQGHTDPCGHDNRPGARHATPYKSRPLHDVTDARTPHPSRPGPGRHTMPHQRPLHTAANVCTASRSAYMLVCTAMHTGAAGDTVGHTDPCTANHTRTHPRRHRPAHRPVHTPDAHTLTRPASIAHTAPQDAPGGGPAHARPQAGARSHSHI